MTVFEAIERDLVAKINKHSERKDGNNSRTSQLNSKNKMYHDNESGANNCGLPYLSFVSDLLMKKNGGGKQPDEIRLSMAVWMGEWTRYSARWMIECLNNTVVPANVENIFAYGNNAATHF